MADSKISDLTPGTITASDDIVFVQSGETKTDTVQGILDLSSSSSLATDDQVIDENNRNITLNGAASTNLLTVENNAGSDVIQMRGDDAVSIPTGYLGVGTTALGSGFGGHKVYIVNSMASTNAVNIVHSGANGTGVNITSNQTAAGAGYGFKVASTNSAASVSKIGAQYNISGGATNYAIDITAGDIRLNTSTGAKFGVATNNKIGFWNTTPIVQPAALTAADATATDGTLATAETIINNLRVRLNELEAALSAAGGGSGLIA